MKDEKTGKKRGKVPNPAGKAGVPVSLYPLSFDEAMSGLAQTKPPQKQKPQAKPRKANG